MKKELKNEEVKNVIPFQNEFDFISPQDLEDIMESLDDKGYLSEKGKCFRIAFWNLFIKKNPN